MVVAAVSVRRLSLRTLAFAERDLEWYYAVRHAALGVRASPPEPVTSTSDPDKPGSKLVQLGDLRHADAVRRAYIVEPRLWSLAASERCDIEALYCPPPVRRSDKSDEPIGVVGVGAPLLAHEFFRVPDTNVRAVGLALRLVDAGRKLLEEFRPREGRMPRWVDDLRERVFARRLELLGAYARVDPWDRESPAVERAKPAAARAVARRVRVEPRDVERRCHRCGAPGGEECGRECPSSR